MSNSIIDQADVEFFKDLSVEPRSFGPFGLPGDASVQYILREASEEAHVAYKNASMKALKMVESEVGANKDTSRTTISEGGHEADTLLVQKCLFQVMKEGKEVPVKLELVKGLPRRITQRLYTLVRKLSEMDVEEETVEFLTKRIERDTKKVEALKKGKGEEAAKNG